MKSTVLLGVCIVATFGARVTLGTEVTGRLTAAQQDYLLSCGGCHGTSGVSNRHQVPTLQGLVGYFLELPEGRAYLPQLPNVAFANLTDQRLADVLNYVVFAMGGTSVPARAEPYTADEVGRLRKQPLTAVSLSAFRRQLVDRLIQEHHASTELRIYDGLYPSGR